MQVLKKRRFAKAALGLAFAAVCALTLVEASPSQLSQVGRDELASTLGGQCTTPFNCNQYDYCGVGPVGGWVYYFYQDIGTTRYLNTTGTVCVRTRTHSNPNCTDAGSPSLGDLLFVCS